MTTPTIGHNGAPDPIDEAIAPFSDAIAEAENWLDGEPVENEAQMNAVDALIKELRGAKSELTKAQKSATAPLHDAWKAEIARWKPTADDIERRLKGLAACVDPFKRKLAAEREAEKRKAYEEARAAERAAAEAAEKAAQSDYQAQFEADQLKRAALDAKKAAAAANKDTVKGLRTVTKYEVTDHRDLLHWIAKNDRDAITAFVDEWARRNHKPDPQAAGLRVWTEKEAY
jgi:chromosome segregation ATPase